MGINASSNLSAPLFLSLHELLGLLLPLLLVQSLVVLVHGVLVLALVAHVVVEELVPITEKGGR